MAFIPLTRGQSATVDESDLELAGRYKWHAVGIWGTFYAARSLPQRGASPSKQFLHQLLTGWPLVDHIDCNGLNNSRSNLRPATRQQNLFNRFAKDGTSSVYKGVSWNKARKVWRAVIKADGRQLYLGSFADEIEAARAFDAAAREVQGEFARLNFPRSNERAAVRTR